MSPVRATLRSSSALVAVVVPWTMTAPSSAPAAVPASAAWTPPAWFATVVGTLATRTSPLASSTSTRSVNVPPTSTPTSLVGGIYPRIERGRSGDMGHGSRRWDEREPSRRTGPCQARRPGLRRAGVRPGREPAVEVAVQVVMEGLLLRRHAPRSVREGRSPARLEMHVVVRPAEPGGVGTAPESSHHGRLPLASLLPDVEGRVPDRDHPVAHGPQLDPA